VLRFVIPRRAGELLPEAQANREAEAGEACAGDRDPHVRRRGVTGVRGLIGAQSEQA